VLAGGGDPTGKQELPAPPARSAPIGHDPRRCSLGEHRPPPCKTFRGEVRAAGSTFGGAQSRELQIGRSSPQVSTAVTGEASLEHGDQG